MTHFLIDQTSREALNTARAEELLKGLEEGVTSVKLSGKSFGDGSAEVAAAALQRAAPTLKFLDIADIIASRPEDEAKRALSTISEALSSCKYLEHIDLSDNALGAKGIRAVQSLLAGQKTLKELLLCNNGLAADAGSLITAAVLETAPTTLTKLHFHNNLLETAGSIALAPIIENSPRLEDFRFSSLRLGRDGAVRLCQAMQPRLSSTLREVNISDNSFGDEGAEALALAVSNAPLLEKLVVNDALLGDNGARVVCNALSNGAPKLRILNISGNEVGRKGAKALANLLKTCHLRELRAEDNEFGSTGAVSISKGIREEGTLNILTLNCSEIGGRGALAIASAMSRLSGLQLLKLDGNAIPEEAVSHLTTLLGDKLGPLDDNIYDEEEDDSDDEEEEEREEERIDDEEEKETNGEKPTALANGIRSKARGQGEADEAVESLTEDINDIAIDDR